MSKGVFSADEMERMQAIVDRLADDLQRSVAVDNTAFELVCASAHTGMVDEPRVRTIIERTPPPEPVPWMLSFNIASSRSPVRLPANDAFGMLPRVCVPLRFDSTLSGYLWLFDEPLVTAEDLARVKTSVPTLAEILHRRDGEMHARAEKLAILTRRSISPGSAESAVATAVEEGLLAPSGQFVVLAYDHDLDDAGLQRDIARSRTAPAFLAETTLGSLTAVTRVNTDNGAKEVRDTLDRLARHRAGQLVSLGSARAHDTSHLAVAAKHARFARDLNRISSLKTGELRWEAVGSWSLLLGHPLVPETVAEISQDAERLLSLGTPLQRETVIAYLDNARSVSSACTQLSIHRATLHYRLERVRELLDADALNDGWRATSLHVALKLHELLNEFQR